jgi:hypothetical protein
MPDNSDLRGLLATIKTGLGAALTNQSHPDPDNINFHSLKVHLENLIDAVVELSKRC